MTTVLLTPYGQSPVMRTLARGWNRLASDIGCELIEGAGVQFRTARGGWYAIKLDDGRRYWEHAGYLPPRAILTIRPDSPAPTLGLLRPHGQPADFNGPGGFEISACGDDGSLHDHDSIMQRCPVALTDMATGKLRAAASVPTAGYYRVTRGFGKVTTLPEYVGPFVRPADMDASKVDPDWRSPADATAIPAAGAELRAKVLAFLPYDGQHLIRSYRIGMLKLSDPFVRSDLRALSRDAEVAWNAAREGAIRSGPANRGNGEIGREWGWVALLASIVEGFDNPAGRWLGNLFGLTFTARLRRIAVHVQSPCGLLQRLSFGSFWGSPDPWGSPPAGSGVPKDVAVAQDLESFVHVVALNALGLRSEAKSLAGLVLDRPETKWLDSDTGGPRGIHGPTQDQVWPALAVWLRLDPRAALAAVTKWKVPTFLGGGWAGPFAQVDDVQHALDVSQEQGKVRNACVELAKLRKVAGARRAA